MDAELRWREAGKAPLTPAPPRRTIAWAPTAARRLLAYQPPAARAANS